MIASGGWSDFTMPSCVAPGKYLLRAEIIALHSATKSGGAQFYIVSISAFNHLPYSLPVHPMFDGLNHAQY